MQIWVDSDVLRRNRANRRKDPPIIVQQGLQRKHVHEVQVAPGVVMKYVPSCNTCGVVALYLTDGAAERVVVVETPRD